MKLMIDLNVILDILMNRQPFAGDSLAVCNGADRCLVSAHMVTTAVYLTEKFGPEASNATLDFLLNNFTVVPCNMRILAAARLLEFNDYEDVVVAVSAQKAGCRYIVTRSPRDFARSPVPAITPGEFLAM